MGFLGDMWATMEAGAARISPAVRAWEDRAVASLEDVRRAAGTSARDVAEHLVEADTVDATLDAVREAAQQLETQEDAMWSHVARVASSWTGHTFHADQVKRTGRVVIASVVCAEVLAMTEGEHQGVHHGPGSGTSAPSDAVELPAITYDGMGNMDGTTTFSDGGMSYDG